MSKNKLKLKASRTIQPVIYCYTTPNDKAHDGWCKIGYTDSMSAEECVYRQSRRTDTKCVLEWEALAVFDCPPYDAFTDHDFHDFLETACGIERKESEYNGKRRPEYFRVSPEDARSYLDMFKKLEFPEDPEERKPRKYVLREEQKAAVELVKSYMLDSHKKEALINAKPRFGKTITVYDYCHNIDAKNILVVTNRPVIASSWYDDYIKFLGADSEYSFVSTCSAVKGRPHCLTYRQYCSEVLCDPDREHRLIEFVSLQNLKGSKWLGGKYDKLKEITDIQWDLLVVDESHEGVDTFKTNVAFDRITRQETIFLSGTPFKQIANQRFDASGIYNWTYADEQEKKANWDYGADEVNPYADLPQLNMCTYRLDQMFADDDRLDEISSAARERFFNLNEFFRANDSGTFVYEDDVDVFLNMLTTDEKYPLANPETAEEVKHSLWLLDRVNSAKALEKKMKKHPKFAEYHIVVAAGDGKIEDDEKSDEAFNQVIAAINKYDKTITISVGQLTTGVTIKEWSGVFMLSNLASASLYIQAAFRAQNPCLVNVGAGQFIRKENAYIFDFDPARSLDIIDQFANDLYAGTSAGRGTVAEREENIRKLMQYFPISGEDENGELISYKPEDIIKIPAQIHSREIVRHGFMCNFLFQNVGRIFQDSHAFEILNGLKEHKAPHTPPTEEERDGLSYDEHGNTEVDEDKVNKVIENAIDIYPTMTPEEQKQRQAELARSLSPTQEYLDQIRQDKALPKIEQERRDREERERRRKIIKEQFSDRISNVSKATTEAIEQTNEPGIINPKKIEKDITEQFTKKLETARINHEIELEELLDDFKSKVCAAEEHGALEQYTAEYNDQVQKLDAQFTETLDNIESDFVGNIISETVTDIEIRSQEKKNKKAEDDFVFPKLRAFSRSIPSFLMAYGSEETTCDKFSEIIPPEIFHEMTGIELEDYNYLIENEYFNEIAFNDAIKEFFRTRTKLANYFDENAREDIFDYIPPQKTNQIFTPKPVVIHMVDLLEEDNPGCFDDDSNTFIDFYMKSGLYITEIVKRLFKSPVMKEKYPDDHDRLRHIFAHQVYGIAPTAIIYNIAKNYILGFSEDFTIDDAEHHIVLCENIIEISKQKNPTPYLRQLFGANTPSDDVADEVGDVRRLRDFFAKFTDKVLDRCQEPETSEKIVSVLPELADVFAGGIADPFITLVYLNSEKSRTMYMRKVAGLASNFDVESVESWDEYDEIVNQGGTDIRRVAHFMEGHKGDHDLVQMMNLLSIFLIAMNDNPDDKEAAGNVEMIEAGMKSQYGDDISETIVGMMNDWILGI